MKISILQYLNSAEYQTKEREINSNGDLFYSYPSPARNANEIHYQKYVGSIF